MAANRDQTCDWCGIHYRAFRTGLTYGEVYLMLWSYDEDPKTWRYKRRHTVLGLWYKIKQDMWRQHVAECTKEMVARCQQTQ